MTSTAPVHRLQKILLLTFVLASAGCSMQVSEQVLDANKKIYAQSTASILASNGGTILDCDLDAISAEDEDDQGYVEVVAWKAAKSAMQYYKAPGNPDTLGSKYLTWVVQTSQYQAIAKELKLDKLSGQRLALRLEQALGLPPTADTTKLFLVMKVKRSDLFRPCADPEVNDCTCARDFPAGFYSADTSYKSVYRTIVEQTAG